MQKVKEKRERALGAKLFIKAERCDSPKCAMIRKPYRPGLHGQKHRSPVSEYGRQLKEKQKVQLIYGLRNRHLKNLLEKYTKDKILDVLERRLDRVLFLLGFAKSPIIARQLISHSHILVNKRKVTISSYNVKIGDVIEIRERSKKLKVFEDLKDELKKHTPPEWLRSGKDLFKGECVAEPEVSAAVPPFDIDLVGEFYSK